VDFVNRVGSSVGDTYTDCIVMLSPAENAFLTDPIT